LAAIAVILVQHNRPPKLAEQGVPFRRRTAAHLCQPGAKAGAVHGGDDDADVKVADGVGIITAVTAGQPGGHKAFIGGQRGRDVGQQSCPSGLVSGKVRGDYHGHPLRQQTSPQLGYLVW
jgi:hypothetical protein